jgi:hypothetical protein
MLLELEEREEEAGAGSWVCVLFWTTSAIAEQQQCVWGSEISSSLVRAFWFRFLLGARQFHCHLRFFHLCSLHDATFQITKLFLKQWQTITVSMNIVRSCRRFSAANSNSPMQL